ncbi:MAG: 3-dehydroquinate synthase [Phycisphaerales bacterium]
MGRSTAPATFDVPMQVPARHRVTFTRDVFDPGNPALAQALAGSARCIAFVDAGVAEAHPQLAVALARSLVAHPGMPELCGVERVPGGERAKAGMEVPDRVVRATVDHRIDRQSCVIAIGGGAVLDAVGFGAAIAHRGCRLVRLPTTVLSQDDAGMAVKNGINLGRRKNYVGTFAVPHAVICDEAFLESTPEWSWIGGFSEAVKIALLRDPALLARIERDAAGIRARDMLAAMPVIVRSAELHWRHIALGGDPFETRSARPLDHGHWLAHRLEGLTDGALPHGQAVAIGIAVDTAYAANAGILSAAEADRVMSVLRALSLPTSHPLLSEPDALIAGLEEFREHLGGRLTITLLRAVGDPVDVHEVDERLLRGAIASLAG